MFPGPPGKGLKVPTLRGEDSMKGLAWQQSWLEQSYSLGSCLSLPPSLQRAALQAFGSLRKHFDVSLNRAVLFHTQ